jgi:hypothetical protein
MKNRVYNLQVEGKRVVVRVDFNVPLKDGVIQDDNRIVQALPTIKFLVENGAKVILLSHLGKIDHKDPEKKAAGMKKNNMAPIAVRLGELLNKEPFHRLEYEGVGIYRVSNFSNTRVRFINSDAQYINDDVYDSASTNFETKGVSAVRIGSKCNLLKPDGTYCSDVWFDAMSNIRGTSCFNVYIEGYGNNIIDVHGKMLSSVWFTSTGDRCPSSKNHICRMYMDKNNNVWVFKAEGDSGIVVPSNKADFL